MHQDAERVAKRFNDVLDLVAAKEQTPLPAGSTYRDLILETVNELLTAEVIFPGPSLYAEP